MTNACDFQMSMPWFDTVINTTLDPGDDVRIVCAHPEEPHTANAVLPLRFCRKDLSPFPVRALETMTNMYSTCFMPGADAHNASEVARAVVDACASHVPEVEALQFDSFDTSDALFWALHDELGRAKFASQPFFFFGNWYENTADMSYDEYFESRPSKLKNTIRRKGKKLSRDHQVEFALHRDASTIEDAIRDYDEVYQHSWKVAEPYPKFTSELIIQAAGANALRLGVLKIDGAIS